jgi:3-methyladenine DNA glycosylase AlkD
MTLADLRRTLRGLASPTDAAVLQSFFKTAQGEYGEGDRFLGIRVPALRRFVRQAGPVPLDRIARLIRSPYHEERLAALLLLVRFFETGRDRAGAYRFYLRHTRWINNWDLVDLSAPNVLGAYLLERSRSPLYRLARSRSIWERRMAMVATHQFIRRGDFGDTLGIARLLLRDPHDLLHKAAGWMLREVGKRDGGVLEAFLRRHAAVMPRTMLRYAIERFPERTRRAYLRAGR